MSNALYTIRFSHFYWIPHYPTKTSDLESLEHNHHEYSNISPLTYPKVDGSSRTCTGI